MGHAIVQVAARPGHGAVFRRGGRSGRAPLGQDDAEPGGTFEELDIFARIGVPPADILRAATLSAARAVGRDGDLVSLKQGKVGDVVLFRENLLEKIARLRLPWLVMQRGEVIYERD